MEPQYQRAFNYYKDPNGELYHLLEYLKTRKQLISVDDDELDKIMFPICIQKCAPNIRKNKPGQEYSMANNEDYGNLAALGHDVNQYSMATLMAISPIRLIKTVVGVNQELNAYKVKGHCISFESDHLAVLESDINRIVKIGRGEDVSQIPKIMVPNVNFHNSINISFQGPKEKLEHIRTNLPGMVTPAQVDKEEVIKICQALLHVNTAIYKQHCQLPDDIEETKTELQREQNLVNDTMVSDTRLQTREMSKSAASDVAKPLSDIPNIDFEHVLICNKKITKGSAGNSKKIMLCMPKH
jgi:hypothetical protein